MWEGRGIEDKAVVYLGLRRNTIFNQEKDKFGRLGNDFGFRNVVSVWYSGHIW